MDSLSELRNKEQKNETPIRLRLCVLEGVNYTINLQYFSL